MKPSVLSMRSMGTLFAPEGILVLEDIPMRWYRWSCRHRAAGHLVLMALTSCSGADSPAPDSVAWPDVPAVVSHAEESLPAPWEYTVILEIGADAGAGREDLILRAPFGLLIMPGGEIVIGDSKPLQLRAFSSEGIPIASFAQPGDGPGDLGHGPYGWYLRSVGERVFELWSRWPPRIQTWDLDGRLLSLETLDAGHPLCLGGTTRTLICRDDLIFWVGLTGIRDREHRNIYTTHIVRGDSPGSRADTLTSIVHEPVPALAGMVQAGVDYMTLLKDHVLFTRGGRCYVASWLEDWIAEIDPATGVPIRRFCRVHTPGSMSESLKESFVEAIGMSSWRSLEAGFIWLQERVSLLWIAEGPDGQILVQRTGEAETDDLWPTDVFSGDGEYLGCVMLPVEPRTVVVRDSHIYGLGTNRGEPVIRVLTMK